MTAEEYRSILENDMYLVERKAPTPAEEQLYLRETNFHCCLCGKELRSRMQKKPNKLYEIAHIFPNRPTQPQYLELSEAERLGKNSEAFENKIALCKDCHSTQDDHTSLADYCTLLEKKKTFLRQTALHDATNMLGLEDEVYKIIMKISELSEAQEITINYRPVPLSKKFTAKEKLLKSKVSGYVTEYFPYIRECFQDIEGVNGFNYTVLCIQVKSAFIKANQVSQDKIEIYEALTQWIQSTLVGCSLIAAEILVAYFIQSCEVFNEIS